MRAHVAVLAALLAAGCGSKKKDGGGSGDRPRHSSQPATGPLEGLFKPGAGKPTLPPPFAGAKLGSTLDELHKAVPETAKDDYLVSPDFAKVSYYVGADDAKQHFSELRVGVPLGSRAKLTAAWGEPIVMKATGRDEDRALWLNPELTLKAVLEEDKEHGTVVFEAYTPIATLLGDGKDHFGFETASMLGQPIKDLETAYKAHHDRTLDTLAFFKFDPTEYDERFQLEVGVKDGKATSQQFWLHHGDNEKLKADMRALLEKKFGPSHEATENEGTPYAKKQTVFDGTGFTATLAETKGAWVIETAPAAPAAK